MEKLYNNIVLPDEWPPKRDIFTTRVMEVPYLEQKPEVIDITVGRQLFVDDFLIASSDLKRVCHRPVKFEGNPIMRAETPLEKATLPCTCPKSGGVWYDKFKGKYCMWYEAGWLHRMAYAESEDGLNWVRPELDVVPGTNEIIPGVDADSSAVFIDYDTTDPSQRYKMFFREPGGMMPGRAYVSADGIHWSEPTFTSPLQDRSTMFYNPFRRKWVYSIRHFPTDPKLRLRYYRECDDFLDGAVWDREDGTTEKVYWMRPDHLDKPDPYIQRTPELYNFDAVAYESIMLGMFQLHYGPENGDCKKYNVPKITELQACYSRDGFHFSRPDRKAFIPASRTEGNWDRGYVQSVGGLCTVHEDEIWFYYIGFAGGPGRSVMKDSNLTALHLNGMHDNSATGIAKLRRDGFASLEGSGSMMTERLTVAEGKNRLFINAKTGEQGSLRAELLDAEGNPAPGFTLDDCIPFTGDSTRTELCWKDGRLPTDEQLKTFRLRFTLENASFWAFWLSDNADGRSGGFDAAGSRTAI
ncbi:MAG: glycosyl hydrolase family 32 [Clostridia bacterium]|nr:glycosyl hydrolase family 32 [Clostridia bacterium]